MMYVLRENQRTVFFTSALCLPLSCQKRVNDLGILSANGSGSIVLSIVIGQHFILQQENAPIHTAKLKEWPPQGADLSTKENARAIFKMRISEEKPKILGDLKDCITRHCLKLVNSNELYCTCMYVWICCVLKKREKK